MIVIQNEDIALLAAYQVESENNPNATTFQRIGKQTLVTAVFTSIKIEILGDVNIPSSWMTNGIQNTVVEIDNIQSITIKWKE